MLNSETYQNTQIDVMLTAHLILLLFNFKKLYIFTKKRLVMTKSGVNLPETYQKNTHKHRANISKSLHFKAVKLMR